MASSSIDKKKHAIICAGLNCLDLQLLGCTKSGQEEAIEQYEAAVYCAGGSASMAATTLAQIDGQRDVFILTKLGADLNGRMMLDFFTKSGARTDLCLTSPDVATALSVLPIFKTGGRGCFFNLASNNSFTAQELLLQIEKLISADTTSTTVDAFLFGYPHLLPLMQGDKLATMLQSVRERLGRDALIGVDLNGVSIENHNDHVLGPALLYIDVLHLNEEEAEILSGCKKQTLLQSDSMLQDVCSTLHKKGCAVIVLSMGSKGSFLSVTGDKDRLAKCPKTVRDLWTPGQSARSPAFSIAGDINANGAGDALFSSFCWAASTQDDMTLEQAGAFASLVAQQRCDVLTRDQPKYNATELVRMVKSGDDFPPVITL
eukprot:scaffold10095_cov163-Amphora_coffeaeformis.AAC.6